VGRAGSETEIVVADIPGLVAGAAEGRGLGHRFLRHVERARVLLLMLDLAPADGRQSAEQERILLEELSRYRPELLERPRLVVGSKCDAVAARDPRMPELCISSVSGEGLSELLGRLAVLVNEERAMEGSAGGSIVVHRPAGEGVEIVRDGDGSFVVEGRAALRAVALSDLTDDDAVAYVQGRLRRLGVERALVRAGIRDGDTVRLGPLELTYRRDESVLETARVVARQSRRARSRRGSGRAR